MKRGGVLEEIDLESIGDVVDIEIYLTTGLDSAVAAAAHNVPGFTNGVGQIFPQFSDRMRHKRISDLCRRQGLHPTVGRF